MNKSFAYIRVSSKDQNEARQREAIKGLEINERDIFTDKQSGKDFDRPQYQALKANLRRGDTLYIKELDRLGRNADEIKREWQELTTPDKDDPTKGGVYIVVLDMPVLDTRPKPNGMGDMDKLISNIVLELLSYMAQKERDSIRSRQAEGIAAAHKDGIKFGRPKQAVTEAFKAAYDEWKTGTITAVEAMKRSSMGKDTFYRRVKEYEGQQ